MDNKYSQALKLMIDKTAGSDRKSMQALNTDLNELYSATSGLTENQFKTLLSGDATKQAGLLFTLPEDKRNQLLALKDDGTLSNLKKVFESETALNEILTAEEKQQVQSLLGKSTTQPPAPSNQRQNQTVSTHAPSGQNQPSAGDDDDGVGAGEQVGEFFSNMMSKASKNPKAAAGVGAAIGLIYAMMSKGVGAMEGLKWMALLAAVAYFLPSMFGQGQSQEQGNDRDSNRRPERGGSEYMYNQDLESPLAGSVSPTQVGYNGGYSRPLNPALGS